MEKYLAEREKYQTLFQQISKLDNLLSLSRLLLIVFAAIAGFQYYKTEDIYWGIAGLACLLAFLILVRWHTKVAFKKKFYKQLVQINEYEIAAGDGDFSNFNAGEKYVDPHHAYTFDLDVFGKNSIFQYLNRTANIVGADRLAQYFLQHQSKAEIYETQNAIIDLSPRLEWRQEFLAMGQLHADQHGAYQTLLKWAELPVKKTNVLLQAVWYIMTFSTVATGLTCIFHPTPTLLNVFQLLATFNLIAVIAHAKKIRAELLHINAIYKIVAQYGTLLRYIEKEEFTSQKLLKIQQHLKTKGKPASKAITDLSYLLNQLESVQNMIAALIYNCFFMYHIHILLALERWKTLHAPHVKRWIDGIGEMEALSSLAHFAYNNPEFVFPEISDAVELKMIELGHPLIPKEKRICNSITFEKSGFVILTGSNMSGKSTFLRTIGINLLLAKTGTPVCGTECRTFPFEVFVCMKLTDSLHDNESYFYAELKRLKRIIESLEAGAPGFVLLDEVLRGTNSNDKLTGTLGLVKTMVRINATGLLATHDLNVCDLSSEYPKNLRNMCFEVEMTTDNLHFDYKLRNGVCVNKSASFLMKKMGVI